MSIGVSEAPVAAKAGAGAAAAVPLITGNLISKVTMDARQQNKIGMAYPLELQTLHSPAVVEVRSSSLEWP